MIPQDVDPQKRIERHRVHKAAKLVDIHLNSHCIIEAMKVTDKVVVVTGGATGIGRALCRRFAAEGARAVVVADIDAAGAEAVAGGIGGGGGRVRVRWVGGTWRRGGRGEPGRKGGGGRSGPTCGMRRMSPGSCRPSRARRH